MEEWVLFPFVDGPLLTCCMLMYTLIGYQAVTSLAVHPSLPHVIATGSIDETISLWDISVPITKPDTIGKSSNAWEQDKRRKGFAEGERLAVYGGFGGHKEPVLSIVRPTLCSLVSST